MDAFWTGLVAVGGTLMGVVTTHLFQRRAALRGERFARSESLRQERMAAFGAFAAAAEDYRHGQATRWYLQRQDPDGDGFVAARDEAHRLRTATRNALYRVKLLTDDQEVTGAADDAYRSTRDVSTARDPAERDGLDAEARQAIEAFVSRASTLIR